MNLFFSLKEEAVARVFSDFRHQSNKPKSFNCQTWWVLSRTLKLSLLLWGRMFVRWSVCSRKVSSLFFLVFSDMNAMRGGGFFTYFRNHLKAWISLAVVTQCLFLIWYHRQAFLLAQDLVALWKQQNVRLVQQSGIRIGIQIKDHAEQHSRESSTNNSLQTAPKILSRKIDGEIDLENVNADKPPEDGLTISSELHHEQNLNRTKSGGGVSALSKPSEAFSHNKVALAKESKNLKPQIRKSLKNIPHGITYDPQAFNSSTKYTFNTIQKTKQGFYPSFVSIPQLFELNSVSPTTKYFEPRQFGNNTYQCYKAGTKTKAPSGDEPCSCEKGWHGKWCSFPDCFSNSAAAR